MRFLYVGNFTAEHNTERHLLAALREWGEVVVPHQLSAARVRRIPNLLRRGKFDVMLWTHSSHLCRDTIAIQQAFDAAKTLGVMTAAFHLDRYWDLERQSAISTEPWWKADLVMTADGSNQDLFAAAGVNHFWIAPACHGPDAELIGIPREQYRAKVAFVGSWQRYHAEWPWRMKMIDALRERYGEDFACFPDNPRDRIYGQALSDLYASVDVVVGDSIFAGRPNGIGYTSDRPYLTLGQGGCLVMPYNPPLQESFFDGIHLRYYEPENLDSLFSVIDELLDDPDQREALRQNGQDEVLANHLYRHRVREMVQLMTEQRVSLLGWPGEVRHNTHDATAIRETWLDDVYGIKDSLKPGDVVVDCGANVGAFTIAAALQGAEVIAVEPVPDNQKQLRKNIEMAGVTDRVSIWECAVGEKDGTIKLGFFDVDKSQSAFRQNDGDGEIEVPVRTLETILRHEYADDYAFLKMDIEGSERWALPGAPLHRFRRIAIETHNTLDPGTTHQRCIDWLMPTHEVTHSGGHSEGYVYGVRRES